MAQLAFWPDYDGLIWDSNGKVVPVEALDLPAQLAARLTTWASSYDDLKLPIDTQGDDPSEGNAGDPVWLAEGAELFDLVRTAVASNHSLVVTEPWWDDATRD